MEKQERGREVVKTGVAGTKAEEKAREAFL